MRCILINGQSRDKEWHRTGAKRGACGSKGTRLHKDEMAQKRSEARCEEECRMCEWESERGRALR